MKLKTLIICFGALTASLLTACQHQTYPNPNSQHHNPYQAPLIGQTVHAARSAAQNSGRLFRVIRENGQQRSVTYDYRPGRINAIVENGIVVDYQVE